MRSFELHWCKKEWWILPLLSSSSFVPIWNAPSLRSDYSASEKTSHIRVTQSSGVLSNSHCQSLFVAITALDIIDSLSSHTYHFFFSPPSSSPNSSLVFSGAPPLADPRERLLSLAEKSRRSIFTPNVRSSYCSPDAIPPRMGVK